jgi:hypothetical protein
MKCLLVPCAWSDEGPAPQWMGDLQSLGDRTRAWYLQESYGQIALDFTIAPIVRLSDSSSRITQYPTGAAETGYDRVVYLTSRNTDPSVGFKGLNGGVWSWINCMGSDYEYFAIIHELGHSFGLAHPFSLSIGNLVGRALVIPSLDVTGGGQLQDLYDKSTSMGYEATFATFNGPEECQLGWTTPLIYSGGDKTVTLTALGVPGAPDALRVVKIPMTAWRAASARAYWVEYRIDTIDANGIEIHTLGDFGCYKFAHVNKSLAAGDSFTDGTVVIDVIATDATTATIRLRDIGGSTMPVLPTLSLTATPALLPAGGGMVQLAWNTADAQTVQIAASPADTSLPQFPATNGSWSAYIAQNTTWTAEATNAFGSTRATVTANVQFGVQSPPAPTPQPPTGNTAMAIDTYKSLVNALVLGSITAAQLAQIDAARATIVPDSGLPSDPVLVPPATSLIGTDGHTYSFASTGTADGFDILEDGHAATGQAVLLDSRGTPFRAKNARGQWWQGYPNWQPTTAP